jgi:pimeloyl-ACP methyl ester carboxylesterase
VNFILIHGALHGGWCWERVVPLLAAAGHNVVAPDLPGMGSDRTPLSTVTLASWAEFVADLIRRQDGPVLLACHSRGGIVISEAGERVPERIRTLIYVTAMLIPPGGTAAGVIAAEMKSANTGFRLQADGIAGSYDPAMAAEVFYNRTPDTIAREAIARLTPEPIVPIATPLAVTPERWGRVPRAYVECTDDHALTLALQRKMQAVLPCDPVVTMESDHSPFLCAPEELAAHLVAIGERRSGRL